MSSIEFSPCPISLHVTLPLSTVVGAGVEADAASVRVPVAEVAKLALAVFLCHVVPRYLLPLELKVLAGFEVGELATLPVAVNGI